MKFKEFALIAFILCIIGFQPFDTYVLHHGDAEYAQNKEKVLAQGQATGAEARAKKEGEVAKNCAAARQKHDQLYKAGVAHPEEQVDVRAACEPDKVAQETAGKWILAAVLLVAAFFMLPRLLFAGAPR
jgi:hypothetical protein